MSTDIARIKSWAQIFHDPKAAMQMMVGNVITNFEAIIKDAGQLGKDIKNDDYMGVGSDAADIVVLTVGKVPESYPEDLEITNW